MAESLLVNHYLHEKYPFISGVTEHYSPNAAWHRQDTLFYFRSLTTSHEISPSFIILYSENGSILSVSIPQI